MIDKKILILGLGREGESSYRFFRKLWPKKIIALADQTEKNQLNDSWQKIIKEDKYLDFYGGSDYLNHLLDYQIIVKSPGISFRLKKIKEALEREVVFTSQTEICLHSARERIIGVTGTKGKTTTSSLIHHLIKDYQSSTLIGNMGIPAFSFWQNGKAPDGWLVYEMSSHQLDRIKESPHIAVLLNLGIDHLDYFENTQEYYQSKKNIFQYQRPNDYLIYNCEDEKINELVKASPAQKIPFSFKKTSGSFCYWDHDQLYCRINDNQKPEVIFDKQSVAPITPILAKNIIPAVVVAKLIGISNKSILSQIKTFKMPHYRLEFVGKYKGITFYNDSAATIPEATIAALYSLGNQIDTLIVGGSDKGSSFEELIKSIIEHQIQNLIVFPTTGLKIAKLIKTQNKFLKLRIEEAKNMEEAVRLSYMLTEPGKICLLSPASASFTIFNNYEERGELFNYWVKKLSENDSKS